VAREQEGCGAGKKCLRNSDEIWTSPGLRQRLCEEKAAKKIATSIKPAGEGERKKLNGK